MICTWRVLENAPPGAELPLEAEELLWQATGTTVSKRVATMGRGERRSDAMVPPDGMQGEH